MRTARVTDPPDVFQHAYELRRLLMRWESRRATTEIDTSTISIADAAGDAAQCSAHAFKIDPLSFISFAAHPILARTIPPLPVPRISARRL